MKKLFVCISCTFLANGLLAQANFELAKQMQAKYKDAEMYIIKSTEELKLEKNQYAKNVTISHIKKDQYLALRINKTIPLFEYYDNFSEVKYL